jgi:hypothetical protein
MLRRQFPRNLCLGILVGLMGTFVAAFAARYTAIALILLPYGIDAPFGPLANVIRNSFLAFILLCAASIVHRESSGKTSALPILLLTLQVAFGLFATILLDGFWQSIGHGRWMNDLKPESAPVVLVFALLGQLVAYGGRRAIALGRRPRT